MQGRTTSLRNESNCGSEASTLGVALAGCAAPFLPPGYYISGDPPGTSEYYCGEWRVVPTSCVSPRAVY
jgi:hypothetical protein